MVHPISYEFRWLLYVCSSILPNDLNLLYPVLFVASRVVDPQLSFSAFPTPDGWYQIAQSILTNYFGRGYVRLFFRNGRHQATRAAHFPIHNQFRPALMDNIRFRPGSFMGGRVRSGDELHIGPFTIGKVSDHDG